MRRYSLLPELVRWAWRSVREGLGDWSGREVETVKAEVEEWKLKYHKLYQDAKTKLGLCAPREGNCFCSASGAFSPA